MRRRHLCLVRAWSAAGLLLLFAAATSARADEPREPLPIAGAQATSVKILDARKAGDLSVEVKGRGQSRVKMTITNTTARRLNVVIPAGLVAASAVGQGAAGGAGGGAGGGGLQSMGLGAPGNSLGGFGQFQGQAVDASGLRSVGLAAGTDLSGVVVPAGKSVEVEMPAVCLNFGLPSPSPKDKLTLVDVDDYSRDPRVRKALRSLATLGTSQGTAQAAMWNVCNNLPFGTMLADGEKVTNRHEVALAARFVEALDASSSTDLVDASAIAEGRLFVSIVGDGALEKDARRIAGEIEGLRVLGLPARVVSTKALPTTLAPALYLLVDLRETRKGETSGKVRVMYAAGVGSDASWAPLGSVGFREGSDASAIKAVDLVRTVDRAVSAGFVSARPARKAVGNTTLRVENRLPFTLASVTLKVGASSGAPLVNVRGLGVGPARSGEAVVEGATGSVDRVELNGL